MNEQIKPFPLAWPVGWPRTQPNQRKDGKFTESKAIVSIAAGNRRVMRELHAFGVFDDEIVVSTNVRMRIDGTVKPQAIDPAVAVYWMLDGEQQCIASDLYNRVADNLCAVAATLDAMRAIERHGGRQIIKRAWSGFKAIPSSTAPVLTTQAAAEFVAKYDDVTAATLLIDRAQCATSLRVAIMKTHPDNQRGNQELFLTAQECKRILGVHFGQPF